jgi:multiple sugar transport system substrate-binding protein
MSGEKVEKKKISPSLIIAVVVIIILLAALVYYATLPPKVEVVPTTIVQTVLKTETLPGTTIVRTEERTVVQTAVTTVAPPVKKLNVLWTTEMVPGEQFAVLKAAEDYEKATGVKVDITFYGATEAREKFTALMEAKTPPDLANLRGHTPILAAYRGQLIDVSDIVLDPKIKDDFFPVVLEASYLFDSTTKKKSYYAVPIHLNFNYMHYWKDMLEAAGYKEPPLEWNEFWEAFKKAHKIWIKDGVYGIGIPLSSAARDTADIFDQLLLSQGALILTPEGKLNVDDPKVRQTIANTLKFLVSLYNEGYIPPGATTWTNVDNNKAMLGRKIIMTFNPTLSIPAALSKEDPIAYYTNMVTCHWPKAPDGSIGPYYAEASYVIIPKGTGNEELAKDFAKYILDKKNYVPFITGYAGRYLPVFKSVLEDPFFHNPKDLNIPASAKYFERPLVVANFLRSPAYAQFELENGWGKMIGRVLVDKWSIDDAVNEAIERLKTLFKEYGA